MSPFTLPRPALALVLALILTAPSVVARQPATPVGRALGCNGRLGADPATAPGERWRYGTTGSFAVPLVVRDEAIYAAATPGLIALDPETGDELWVSLPGMRPYWVEPAGDAVYVAVDEELAAVDGARGQERWRVDIGGDPAGMPALGSSIVAIGTWAGDIGGFDRATGAERWRYRLGEPVTSGPAVVEDVVYAGGDNGTLVALGATDGYERWRMTFGAPLAATPTIAGQTLFVVGRLGVYAVDASTGQERWRSDTMHNRYAFPTPPEVVGDTVYVGAGDGALHALDAATGSDRWENLPGLSNYVASEPWIVGDAIVFATQFGGGIVAVDAATRQLRWSYPPDATEEMIWPAVVPAPAGDSVYVTAGFDLAALDSATGEEQWCVTLDSFASRVLVDDEAIYIGTDDAGMIALGSDPTAGMLDATPPVPD